jgi:hypothetical protein
VSFAECNTRQSLCRVFFEFCRVFFTLSKLTVSVVCRYYHLLCQIVNYAQHSIQIELTPASSHQIM